MKKLLLIFLIPISLCAESDIIVQENSDPWYTGPLLTGSPRVIPKGHVNMEPYVLWTVTSGRYNSKGKVDKIPRIEQLNTQFTFKLGLTEKSDLSGNIQSIFTQTRGRKGSSFGDLPLGIDYQVLMPPKQSLIPRIKFSMGEIFPTGKYKHLNRDAFGVDGGGMGSWATFFALTWGQVYQIKGVHWLSYRMAVATTFFTPVYVKGFTVYGGGPFTRGKVKPGTAFVFQAAFEYNLTRNWCFACDFQAAFFQKTKFSGRTLDPIGNPSSGQLSLAPAIEYNWNDAWGVIFGPWFTFKGRNSAKFISYIIAVDYTY